jgi:hypothetical protein
MKTLAATILEQRTELEHFFLESLSEVKYLTINALVLIYHYCDIFYNDSICMSMYCTVLYSILLASYCVLIVHIARRMCTGKENGL